MTSLIDLSLHIGDCDKPEEMASDSEPIPSLWFVLKAGETPEACNESLLHAYELCDKMALSPQFIKEKRVLSMEPGKEDIFVLAKFEGPVFDFLKKMFQTKDHGRCG